MKKISTDELKAIQVGILKKVSSFCEDNHINYWLDYGTLIGAIRHKGFIPWDDDIDLGMLRADFDKFSKTFNSADNQPFLFKSYQTDKHFPFGYGKVMDTRTVLYEPDEKGYKLSVNIDIFVYDNAPDNDNTVRKMYKRRDLWKKLHYIQKFSRGTPSGGLFKKAIFCSIRKAIRLLRDNCFLGKMVKQSKKYADRDTGRIGNFLGWEPFVAGRHIFDSFIEAEFEGEKYKVPVGYDEWLTLIYGDYMQLPPIEKRVTHHSFVAYR